MTRTRPLIYLATFFIFLFSTGFAAEDYSLANFQEKIEAVSDKDAATAIYEDFMTNAVELDVIRNVQSGWSQADPDAALSFSKALAEKNSGSAKYLYLLGRLLETPTDKIETGRKVIALDGSFTYGYRLMLATYQQYLFQERAEEDVREKMDEMLKTDGPMFAKLVEIDPGQTYALQFQAGFQIYTADYDGALATLNSAKELAERWPSTMDFAEVYVNTGNFEKAKSSVNEYLDAMVASGNIGPEERDDYFSYFYIGSLKSASAFDEMINFFKSEPDYETMAEAQYGLACAYALKGDNETAFASLIQAVDNGWDQVTDVTEDSDLAPLHEDARWADVISGTEANWVAGKPERKVETLAEKISEVSPDWTLEDANGEMVSLSSLRGNVLVLDFWATWCGPCRMAMPAINDFVKANGHEDVKVFSINVWERGPKEKPASFMTENDYKMILLYGSNELASDYGIKGIPFLCVIDKEGNIRYRHTGYTPGLGEKLQWWTEDLL